MSLQHAHEHERAAAPACASRDRRPRSRPARRKTPPRPRANSLPPLTCGQRFLRAAPARLDLVGRRLLGHAHHDVRELVLVLAAGLRRDRREIVVDFGLRHLHACCRPRARAAAGSSPRGGCPRGTWRTRPSRGRARWRNSLRRDLVLLRDAQDRALDHLVVDAHAVFLGELQERAIDDEALEHLRLEHVVRRRPHVVLAASGCSTMRFCSSSSYCVSASSLTTAITRSSGTIWFDGRAAGAVAGTGPSGRGPARGVFAPGTSMPGDKRLRERGQRRTRQRICQGKRETAQGHSHHSVRIPARDRSCGRAA